MAEGPTGAGPFGPRATSYRTGPKVPRVTGPETLIGWCWGWEVGIEHDGVLGSCGEEDVMRVLVTAATKHGATGDIAQAIAQTLREEGLDSTVLPPEQVDAVDGYDAVILGSAVYAGHWLRSAKELADRSGSALTARPVWLFSSGPVGDPPKREEDPVDVAQVLAVTGAREHRLFAGKLDRKRLSFPEKAIMSALHAPEGDFRDWRAIAAWAATIAAALRSRSGAESRSR